MQTTISHLKTKIGFQHLNGVSKSQIIIDKFIEACKNLDVSIFEPFMNEDDVFEDQEKYKFLEQLHRHFNHCRRVTLNDFEVTNISTICNQCSRGKRVEQFKVFGVGDQLLADFGFVIDIEDGLLKDIYSCLNYVGQNILKPW